MMNIERMKRLSAKYILNAIGGTMTVFSILSIIFSIIMLANVDSGEYAMLHVFAMAVISGAFCVTAAVVFAVRDSINI